MKRLALIICLAAGVGAWALAPGGGTHGEQREQAGDTLAVPPDYRLTTRVRSYFERDASGAVVVKAGRPVRGEAVYKLERRIAPAATAVVIVDPWVDMATEHLRAYYKPVVERCAVLATRAAERGHPVVVLTVDPAIRDYNTRIHPRLAALVEANRAVLFYHRQHSARTFAAWLRGRGVTSLIYAGIASNGCVIGRELGVLRMKAEGFKAYFVPDASAAEEFGDGWRTGELHRAMTVTISQWAAELIDYREFTR